MTGSTPHSDDLADYYSSHADWRSFADAHKAFWADCAFQQQLIDTVGSKSMAVAVYGKVGDTALAWLAQRIPILGERTPLECLTSNRGRRRLKEMLMRMP